MTDAPNQSNPPPAPKVLPLSGMIGLGVLYCIAVPLAGALAKELGGVAGLVCFYAIWAVLLVIAALVNRKYANPNLPLLSGALLGIALAGPAEDLFKTSMGERWGGALHFFAVIAGAALMIWIFGKIASRHTETRTS